MINHPYLVWYNGRYYKFVTREAAVNCYYEFKYEMDNYQGSKGQQKQYCLRFIEL